METQSTKKVTQFEDKLTQKCNRLSALFASAISMAGNQESEIFNSHLDKKIYQETMAQMSQELIESINSLAMAEVKTLSFDKEPG